MHVDKLLFSKDEALKLLQRYQTHKAYQSPIDQEIERVASLIAKGKMIVRGMGSIVGAGLNAQQLPKLALARADAKLCRLDAYQNGAAAMTSLGKEDEWATGRMARSRIFRFAANSFPGIAVKYKSRAWAPHIPPDIRPRRGIENYHVIWEALWERAPPVDPILVRQIGKNDFYMVLAQWDLTEVEREVMRSRMGTQ